MRAIFISCAAIALLIADASAYGAGARCDGGTTSIPAGLTAQITQIDSIIASLEELKSKDQAARSDVERAISAGSTEPVLYDQLRILQARERDLTTQIAEFQKAKAQLCAAASNVNN